MRLGTSAVRFVYEWEQGADVAGPELAATWARLEIWVGSDCVTRVEDTASQSSRRGIYCSLYPLAEWIAFNWWFLRGHVRAAEYVGEVHAARATNGRTPASWAAHHNLRWSGDGYAWPDLLVLPEGSCTRVLWRPDPEPEASRPIRYLTGGDQLVDSAAVEQSLAQLVESVLVRLEEAGVEATPLADEWAAIQASDPEESAFALAAARVGADPYAIEADLSAHIERAATRLSGDLLDDFLSSVAPHRIDAGLRWIARAGDRLDELANEPQEALKKIREQATGWRAPPRGLPWVIGYHQARRVRDVLDLDPNEPIDVAGIVAIAELPSEDRGLDGLGGTSPSGTGGVVLGRRLGGLGRRFATARALWHFTHEDLPPPFLLSGLHTGRERVERAFAAELLAPATGIAELLNDDSGLIATEDIELAAEHYSVSPLLVRHQIDNQLATGAP
jgi:hypothetical protein